ncbi:MAG: ribosomal protein S18-alanine N-acetyltransferase [Acidimicrobiales bacterium]|nr:ribosomal protein S18-alanine N-acetyltransferase [Acidimicrobiales bacterium]
MNAAVAPSAVVSIAPMAPANLHRARSIDAKVYPAPWSYRMWSDQLQRMPAGRLFVVATLDGVQVGHAGLLVQDGDGHIATVAVDPDYGGRGVGTALVAVLAEEAIVFGLDALTLEVRASNERAQALYRRFGFESAGIREQYYESDGEDAVVMWARNIAGDRFRHRLDQLLETLRLDIDPRLSRVPREAS